MYKLINKVYYERKAQRRQSNRNNNDGFLEWDDENFDYIVTLDARFGDHYTIKERIGKVSASSRAEGRKSAQCPKTLLSPWHPWRKCMHELLHSESSGDSSLCCAEFVSIHQGHSDSIKRRPILLT